MGTAPPTGPALDRIEIRGLVVTTIVGVLTHERQIAQPLRIDLDLHVDLRDAGRSDDLGDTANYGDVAERVAAVVRDADDQLLERLADRVAATVLTIDRVEAVDVTVTKLRPPIPEHLDSTAVRIHRRAVEYTATGSHDAIVALGSNLGDRVGFLRLAVSSLPGVDRVSQVFETDPIGGPDGQGAYLNMVVGLRTSLDPYALLRRCRRIEVAAGRERVVHWGPRTLDVDVLFYDDVKLDDPELTIPHPRFAERRFVLTPLAEVAPERCPPDWNETLPPDGVHPRGPLAEQ
ncbi:2-amino-4-hydroxy-6-hydroxymethyldihydropteridine diphosphokinase [Desertimonas flava]|uniref:2-amino-4-hydroxy-6- hydroxymethyldihydropteridine diphosphokinase n=1 Tax=Desertimonas flava TaxID=2064846 RepID=UPI000E345C7E|nr:2-amino-4-hydroxy-6-hydroxymethyldihydropteridine diphosphokinase [Desertimonas flava]